MKIAYQDFSTIIETSVQRITSLVIEDAQTLYKFLGSMKKAVDGVESGIVISKNETPVNVQKTVILMSDFVNFSVNQKGLLSKIIARIDELSVNERFYQNSQEFLAGLEEHIMNMSLDLPCEIYCEKLAMQNILKSLGISILDDYDTLEQKILAYMDLVRELDGEKLFILVNARCMIPEKRFNLMAEDALSKEHEILFVDNKEYPMMKNEKRIIIDEDLCEI